MQRKEKSLGATVETLVGQICEALQLSPYFFSSFCIQQSNSKKLQVLRTFFSSASSYNCNCLELIHMAVAAISICSLAFSCGHP